MANEELAAALYQKMAAEQNNFKSWLLKQPPADILDHANEYAVREDILMEMEEIDLSDAQAKALLSSPDAMAEVYKDFSNLDDTNHMDTVRMCIEDRADALSEQEHKRASIRARLSEQPKQTERSAVQPCRKDHDTR